MKQFEFNPRIIDYTYPDKDMETIANGVKLYIAKPETLKDAIEKLSLEQLVEVFEEKEECRTMSTYRERLTLTALYRKFLEPKGVSEKEGIPEVYSLVCEKLAMDWLNENIKKDK